MVFSRGESNDPTSARLAKLEAMFWAAPFGQARAAKLAGEKYFQIELNIDVTARATSWGSTIGTGKKSYRGQGRSISDIEREGWELVHAGFVFKETGQVSRDKFLSSGQEVNTTGETWGIYLFRATDQPAQTDEPWARWAEEGHG